MEIFLQSQEKSLKNTTCVKIIFPLLGPDGVFHPNEELLRGLNLNISY
jgi:hypothetical protein